MLDYLPLAKVRVNPVALRPVNLESEKYLQLVDSVRQINSQGEHGILNAVTVRKKADPDTGEESYELIDGLHRLSAAKDVGLETIPAQILSMDDLEVLQAQLIGNIQKVETKPYQYSEQLTRILAADPTLSMSELAKRLGQSPKWLSDRLRLTKIVDEGIQEMIDSGQIGLANAYTLSKLPAEEQGNYIEAAMNDSAEEFATKASARAKEIREAARQGKVAEPAKFIPAMHLRKLSELKSEHAKGDVCDSMCANLNTPTEGFKAAMNWILQLDESTIEAKRSKWQADQDEKDAKKKSREEDRAKKKADKTAKEAEEAAKAAEAVGK